MTKLFILFVAGLTAGSIPGWSQSSLSLRNNLALLSTDIPARDSGAYAPPPPVYETKQAAAASFTLLPQENSFLLHLKSDHNHVTMLVIDSVGDIVQTVSPDAATGGFYELPVLDGPHEPGLYVIKLVINEQVVTFRTIR